MKLQPLGKRIVVLRAPKPKNAMGLYIPEVATEVNDKGLVIEVGSGVTNLEKGQRILFAKFSGHEVKVDGLTLLIMTSDDVIATLIDSDDEA